MPQLRFRVPFTAVIFLSFACAVSIPASAQELLSNYQPAPDSDLFLPPSNSEDYGRAVEQIESASGVYDIRLVEALQGWGGQLRSSGDLPAARAAYSRALQVSRINEGLFNANQIPIVEKLIAVSAELSDWEVVDQQYAYLENLFGKLYDTNDLRLEQSLRTLVAWHIDASNTNLNGRRVDHLRSLHRLYKLRLTVAVNTLGPDAPLAQYLSRRLAFSEYHLYASTGVANERRRQSFYSLSERYLLTLE